MAFVLFNMHTQRPTDTHTRDMEGKATSKLCSGTGKLYRPRRMLGQFESKSSRLEDPGRGDVTAPVKRKGSHHLRYRPSGGVIPLTWRRAIFCYSQAFS